LASQANQVYYTTYPGCKRSKSNWWAVCKSKTHHIVDALVVDNAYKQDMDEIYAITIIEVLEDTGPLVDKSGATEIVDL
jgi:hypothetical protein